jgi:hypothetical protein
MHRATHIWIGAALFALLNLTLVGCSGPNHPQVRLALDEMQLELLAVEDRYYELEHKYLLAQRELQAYKSGQIASTKTETGSGQIPNPMTTKTRSPKSISISTVLIRRLPPVTNRGRQPTAAGCKKLILTNLV